MPSVLTHTAILLLARERLARIERVMSARIAAAPAGQAATDVEVRLRDLARAALDALKTAPHVDANVPGNLAGQTVADGVSRFAVMGSMGPDLTAFAHILRPGQAWVFDTVHKGTPDAHRERMLAGTSDLALTIWGRGRALVEGAHGAGPDREAALNRLKAFVLGHLTHVAGDVISHPLVDDIDWHLGTDSRKDASHSAAEGSHEALVAQRVFGRAGVRADGGWDGWWPAAAEVPPELYGAYAAALKDVYDIDEAGGATARPRGFNPLEADLSAHELPALDDAYVREGYETFRRTVISVVYDFGSDDWAGVLAGVILPLIVLPFLFLILPDTRPLAGLSFDESDPDHADRLAFNLLTLPMLIGSGSALGLQIWVQSLAAKGVEDRMLFGLIAAIVMTVLLVLFLIEGGVRAWPAGARWSILFGVPLVLMAVLAGFAITDLKDPETRRRAAATMIPPGLAFGPMLAFLLLFGVFTLILWGVNGLTGLAGASFDFKAVSFWITTVIWVVAMIVLWVLGSSWLRDIAIPWEPDDFLARQRHAVRLFDDGALTPDLSDIGDPVADQRLYPAGRRALARLWWTGGGTMEIRSDRYGLAFRLDGGDPQVVPAPLAPMRLSEYLAFLTATVRDGGGATGSLRAAATDTANDVFLPPGATFAAHGDDADTEDAVREGAAAFRTLGTEDAEDAYVLHHATKSWQSVRTGRSRVMPRPFADVEAPTGAFETAQGFAYVVDPGQPDSDRSVMALAGDFAAMLCLGAMGHIDPPAPAGAGDEPRVFQVFRNWNLDRRRVNEWRMLVAGNARTEKPTVEAYDRALPSGALGPADTAAWLHPMMAQGNPAVIAAAEATGRGLGWVPLLRTWLDRLDDPNADALDETDPGADAVSNRTLTRAIAYLFDRPDPARTPAGGP
jgi:hypothetical protein